MFQPEHNEEFLLIYPGLFIHGRGAWNIKTLGTPINSKKMLVF